jgi:hypothetical protein
VQHEFVRWAAARSEQSQACLHTGEQLFFDFESGFDGDAAAAVTEGPDDGPLSDEAPHSRALGDYGLFSDPIGGASEKPGEPWTGPSERWKTLGNFAMRVAATA